MKPTKLDRIKERKVYDTVIELYNKKFQNYYDEYHKLTDAKKAQ